MSFVAAVITTADKVEMMDLKDKISEITQKITSLKFDVKNTIEESYMKFNVLPQETVKLLTRANTLSNDMSKLSQRVESKTKQDLQNSIGDIKSLSSSLQEANITLQIVGQLLSIDTEMKAANQEQIEGNYFEAAKRIKNLGELIDSTDVDLELLTSLMSEKSLLQESLLYDMMEIWKNCIKWEEAEPEKELKKVSLKVGTENIMKIEQMVQALNYFDYLDFNLKKFGTKLLKYLLMPVITEESNVEILDERDDLAVLEVESKLSSPKPNYTVVFANITKIFKFLHNYLNVSIEENVTFLKKLGEMISEEFCECLIKNCLSDTIPSHSSELELYATVSKATEEFQAYLVEIGFLGTRNQSIFEYAQNVDVLFANKTCQILLGRAREIMKKDLHDTVEVGPITPLDLPKTEKLEETKIIAALKPDIKLSDNTFQFPKCLISKSTNELMELVYEVLEEAIQSTDFCAVRLFCTARNIFELYSAVVPTHHQKFLETIPQQVALFHNNCMYLAHRLVTLSHEFSNRFPLVLKSSTVTFIDHVQKLRELGTSTFLNFMQAQRKQILNIIRESGLATLGEDPTITPSIEKAVRQCLRQLELLHTVWKSVLPDAVYSKSIGCLLNSLVEELIIRVTTVEDIPAATAVHLVTVFSIVIDRAPQVFQEPKQVHRFVKRWTKFKELILILGANLRNIDNRWADGKGPLAHEFTPEEVKQLIRALFQNTERRSDVLARIK